MNTVSTSVSWLTWSIHSLNVSALRARTLLARENSCTFSNACALRSADWACSMVPRKFPGTSTSAVGISANASSKISPGLNSSVNACAVASPAPPPAACTAPSPTTREPTLNTVGLAPLSSLPATPAVSASKNAIGTPRFNALSRASPISFSSVNAL